VGWGPAPPTQSAFSEKALQSMVNDVTIVRSKWVRSDISDHRLPHAATDLHRNPDANCQKK
ncbi:MAG: hypothetical protein P8178_18815, partial [Candidatus Thiodiazotropha sp.]